MLTLGSHNFFFKSVTSRVIKVTKRYLTISKYFFKRYFFCFTLNLLKTFQEGQHYEGTNLSKKEQKIFGLCYFVFLRIL